MIVVVIKEHKILLFVSIVLICLRPVCYVNCQMFLPFEINITDVAYPPEVDLGISSTSFSLSVKYNIKNPNNETINIPMSVRYKLPFYHINATFEENELSISHGQRGGIGGIDDCLPVCFQSFEPGLKTNQTMEIDFWIYYYTEEKLPNGLYTLWIDINYTQIFFPTLISYAFMNITDEIVEIIIESKNRTDVYTRGVNIEHSYIIFSLTTAAIVVLHKRKRKSKKYFI